MADAVLTTTGSRDDIRLTAGAAIAIGEVWQLPDGRAGVYVIDGRGAAAASGTTNLSFKATGQVVMPKTASVVFLDGGRAYWDHSASAVHYKRVDDRDFYLGRFVGDAASADTTCTVNLNVDPPYDIDLVRDAYRTTIIGTQALGGLALERRGGALKFRLDTTNEAQKLDALARDGFATGANAIVEFAFLVVEDGASTAVDVNIGIASGTHASDADSIAKHLFVHLNENNTTINLQSTDGTTTVAATDTTKSYTAGTANTNRVECWFDLRNPADVQCYIDAVLVLPATVFGISAAPAAWYGIVHVEKTSSASIYEFDLDFMRVRTAEQ